MIVFKNIILKVFILTIAISFSNQVFAQIPGEFNIVWNYSIHGEAGRDDFYTGQEILDNFVLLPDSTIVFASRDQASYNTVYLSKINVNGTLLFSKPINGAHQSVYTFMLKKSSDGNLILVILSNGYISIGKYDPDFEQIWTKNIFPPNFDSSVSIQRYSEWVKDIEVLPNGNIILAGDLFDFDTGQQLRKKWMRGYNNNGDSLFYSADPAFINTNTGIFFRSIQIGPGNSFFALTTFLHTTTVEQFSSTDGSLLKQTVFSLGATASELGLISSKKLYFIAITDFYNTVFNLHLADSNLNYIRRIPIPYRYNVTFPELIHFREDQNNGTYFFQRGYETVNPRSNTYAFFGQLDSLGKLLWTYKVSPRKDSLFFNVINIIPLAGNDFLVCGQYLGFMHIYRVNRTASIPTDLTGGTVNQVLVANADKSIKNQLEELRNARDLSIQATPNPARNHFTLSVRGVSNQSLTLTVTDIMGRVLEKRSNIGINGIIRFGNNYRAGIYFVEVRQGETRKKIKLIKL